MKNAEYFYPLYKNEDQELFNLLVKKAKNLDILELLGSNMDFTRFMKLFIYSGKMKDYRQFWNKLCDELKSNKLHLQELIEFGDNLEIKRGIDKSWAIFTQDKRICILLDDFYDSDTEFEGEESDKKEFFIRYWLSQLLQDWRGPKLAIVIESLKQKNIEVNFLNNLLAKWDFTEIF